jgi:hypothetical protein
MREAVLVEMLAAGEIAENDLGAISLTSGGAERWAYDYPRGLLVGSGKASSICQAGDGNICVGGYTMTFPSYMWLTVVSLRSGGAE